MKVLVINAGSSSCKYQLLEMDDRRVLCSGLAERIGQGGGRLTHKIAPDTDKEEKLIREAEFKTHVDAMKLVIALLTDAQKGVIQERNLRHRAPRAARRRSREPARARGRPHQGHYTGVLSPGAPAQPGQPHGH